MSEIEQEKQKLESGWSKTPRIIKVYLFVTAVILGIILFLLFRGYMKSRQDMDYLFNKWNSQDSAKMKVIENRLGQISYIAEATKLTGDQINKYAESDVKLKELTRKYSDLLMIVSKKMGVYVDTIERTFHDTLPCADFEKRDTVRTKDYSFDYLFTKRNFMITKLTFPDTVHQIIGERKSGFLNLKRTLVIEETHSNKFVKVHSMNPVVKVKKNKWPVWLGVGIGVGAIGTAILFK